MNVIGRAKVQEQQENQRESNNYDVAGADEEKPSYRRRFLKAPNKFSNSLVRIPTVCWLS